MVEHFIFAWINFAILVAGLLYLLRKPAREFLSGRREKIRALIVKTRHRHEESLKKHEESKLKIAKAEADANALKQNLIDTGNFGREAIIRRAKDTAERIKMETELSAMQEHVRAGTSLSKDAMIKAFDEANATLLRGISREDEMRILDESLSVLNKFPPPL